MRRESQRIIVSESTCRRKERTSKSRISKEKARTGLLLPPLGRSQSNEAGARKENALSSFYFEFQMMEDVVTQLAGIR